MSSSPRTLCHSGGRPVAGPHALDSGASRFFLPVKVLSRVFRGKFVAGLRALHARGKLGFYGAWLRCSARSVRCVAALVVPPDWVVYAKRPFGGARTCAALSGMLHASCRDFQPPAADFADGNITFRWRDSAHHNKQRLMTLRAEEFLRRFLLHVLPPGLFASGTSDFFQYAAEESSSRSAVAYCRRQEQHTQSLRPQFPVLWLGHGRVPVAAAR